MNVEQDQGRDPLDSIDFRQDSGPPIKDDGKVKVASVTIGFDKISAFFRWIKERIK